MKLRGSVHQLLIFAVVVVALVSKPTTARPCTTFLMDQGGPVVGKSYDWNIGHGLVVINKRGVAKTALVFSMQDTPATWTSDYASVTFNQYGTEFPNGGINEVGLVVEIMWLDASVYPPTDGRPVVNELQWIQHALDGFSTVADLVAVAPTLRVSPAYAAVHYLACDATGACASFEYIAGELVIHTGDDMPVKTLTNNTYANSITYLGNHEGFGGLEPIPTSSSSLARFVRASALALGDHEAPAPASGFAILDSVSQGSSSKWNIVYNVAERRAHFRTYTTNTIKEVALADFDLDCTSPRMILDIDAQLSGDVAASFVAYSQATNGDLIDRSFADIIGQLPPGARDVIAAYPEAQLCTLPVADADGGVGPADAGSADGGAADGGAADGGGADGGGGGCGGCAVTVTRSSAAEVLIALGFFAVVLATRRRRRRRR